MEQVEVEIIGLTVSTQYGTLTQGDVLRVSPEYASHLVNDAKAAKYVNDNDAEAIVEPEPAKPADEPPVIVKKGAGKLAATDSQSTAKASAGVVTNPAAVASKAADDTKTDEKK